MPDLFGTEQVVQVYSPTGAPIVSYGIELGFTGGDRTLDDSEGTLNVFVQGAGSLEDVTFALEQTSGFLDLSVQTADVNGDVGPVDLFIPSGDMDGEIRLRATSPTKGVSERYIVVPALPGGSADPGVDAAPELVGGSTGRWVLQDLMPGGIGSWVMPINPTSMSNPHVTKVVNVRSTTAPTTGRLHVSESSIPVVEWQVSGYCPDQDFHESLFSYAALNRRMYVIDHRGRAWKCAFTALEITPRKRQLEDDGTPQDWAADYRMTFHVLDQTFYTPV